MSRWLAFPLLLACAGRDEPAECPRVSCADGFTLLLSQAGAPGSGTVTSAPLPAGDYEIELSLDDERVLCHASVPGVEPPSCDAGSVAISAVQPLRANPPTTSFVLWVVRAPSVAGVVVRHSASPADFPAANPPAVVAELSYEPSYMTSEATDECTPMCKTAGRQPVPLSF